MEIKPIHVIPLVILAFLIAGGVYYYQKNSSQKVESSPSSNSNVVSVLGASDSASTNVDVINDSQTLANKFGEFKKPVNDAFADLADKMKYQNLFPAEEIIKFSNEIDDKINLAVKNLNDLKIAEKFVPAKEKYQQSLTLLKESLESLRKSYDPNNKNAKADREEFGYKIDQSNKILKDI